MGYYSSSDERAEAQAVLPQDGERLEFGVHRLVREDRTCPMWPLRQANGNARYRNWVRGAIKGRPEVVALLARVKAGEVPYDTGTTIVVRAIRPVTWASQEEQSIARAERWVAAMVEARSEQAA